MLLSLSKLFLAAILFRLSMPGEASLPALAWVSLLPFFAAIEGKPGWQRGVLGLLFGFTVWILCTWWFSVGLKNIGGVSGGLGILITLLPALLGSLPYGLFALLTVPFGLLKKDGAGSPLACAALLTAIIYLAPHPFPGHLGHSQYKWPLTIQISAIGGVSLVLLTIAYVNLLTFRILARAARGKTFATESTAKLLFVVVAVIGYGYLSLSTAESAKKTSPKIKIGLVQPNIPVDEESGPGALAELVAQTEELAAGNPGLDLIIWPELPIAFSVEGRPNDYHAVERIIKSTKTPLLFNSIFYRSAIDEGRLGEPIFYNAVYLAEQSVDSAQTYRKNSLIPFGEYVPLEDAFPILKEIFPDVRRYTPSSEKQLLKLNDILMGPAICLEAIYPTAVEKLIILGANIIISQGNDGYFGNTAGLDMHAALAMFRSIEFGVPLVRVHNSGISQAYDSAGQPLISGSERFKKRSYAVEVSLPPPGRSYDPNRITLIACILLLGARAFSYYRSRNQRGSLQ